MWWHYKEGDKVSWKQRDRKIRPNMDVSDFRERELKLCKRLKSKKISTTHFTTRIIVYLSQIITKFATINNSINSNQLKLIKKN